MSKRHLGLQPPFNPKRHWLVEAATVESGADPTCPDEHTCEDLLQTVCELAYNVRGSWSGSSEEILAAANERNRLLEITPKQINLGIFALQERFEAEGIKHLMLGNISGESIGHVFFVLP